jgi:ribosomal protein L40E
MNPRISLFLFLLLAAVLVAAGCATMQQKKIYTCPSCKAVVPPTATQCPNCGQKLMPVAAAGQVRPGAGTPHSVAQAPGAGGRGKFPPVKVGALLQITDSNHQRITPFVSVEVFRVEQSENDPIICFDVGVAEDAVFGTAGVRGLIPDAPHFGVFFFGMFDFRRTLKKTLLGAHKPHFCVGLGVSLGGF